jgi:hypothetical protein
MPGEYSSLAIEVGNARFRALGKMVSATQSWAKRHLDPCDYRTAGLKLHVVGRLVAYARQLHNRRGEPRCFKRAIKLLKRTRILILHLMERAYFPPELTEMLRNLRNACSILIRDLQTRSIDHMVAWKLRLRQIKYQWRQVDGRFMIAS